MTAAILGILLKARAGFFLRNPQQITSLVRSAGGWTCLFPDAVEVYWLVRPEPWDHRHVKVVNFTGPWGAQILGQTFFCVFLCGYFGWH
jgi:hypothetical protein